MQRRATKLSMVADEPEQLSLVLPRKPSQPVDLKHIPLLTGTDDALVYACKLARRPPKDIYPDMGYEKSVWSRLLDGEYDLDGREIPKFNRVVGNSAYLLYINHLDGWDLASMDRAQDDKDRKIAELERTVADQDRAIRLMVDYHRGGGGRST